VRASARAGEIKVDGRLTEAEWSSTQAATDFRQHEPNEGQPASRTEIRFLYDADALYIGARMYDSLGAAGVRSRLARRDQLSDGDNIELIFDTFHDHTGRTIFSVSPSGARSDAGQAAPFADQSWDPVWEVGTEIDSLGWTAELRIPFSQLRYPRGGEQTWGLQVWRYVERLNEISMWSFWGRQEQGGPPLFGHLEGLRLEDRRLGLEVMPYLVTRTEDVTPTQAGTPLREPTEYGVRAGGDIKALLTSTLTLDATINPDFGQVEVDPAVVNLSAFETFFEERRPFFVEGSGLFGFGGFSCYFCSNVSSLSLFYSRHIGRRPQGSVSGSPRFVEVPDNSTILGAAKITGRSANGLQLGLLNALTAAEKADAISAANEPFEQEVEPLTNYFVGRVKQNFNDGNATLGAIATGVFRRFDNHALRTLMPTDAQAVGGDWNFWWKQRTYNFAGNVALSQVNGDAGALLRLQRASARYFHRPDREHGANGFLTDRYDPDLTTMRGAGAYMRMAKTAGSWLWEAATHVRTPGFEVNDLAFLTRADYLWFNGNILRQWTKPTSAYRNLNLTLGAQQQYNFDGDLTDRQVHFSIGGQLPNYWGLHSFVIHRPQVDDDRLTRGGPVVRRAATWFTFLAMNTDSRKKVALDGSVEYGWNEEGAHNLGVSQSLRLKPAANLSISLGPSYNRSGSTNQYVERFSDPAATHFHGERAVFANLVQHTFSLDTRISATFTPTLTLELVARPFTSSGNYADFKEFTGVRTLQKRPFDGQQLTERREDGRVTGYELNPDRDVTTADFFFDNPDFSVRSLRGNAVLRWEYRPGSTLFVVWQQQRAGVGRPGDFKLGRDTGGIFDDSPDNIFLVKLSYWVGR
ncbi:MAG TPA: DUF5916 domain-containing protein, partial [Longimicrobiales bacterium]|nr:DUF5916 domain-containing protein [Longimicrobiales bacterium]